MIIGIGTDIIEISRIKDASATLSFLNKCFTPEELEYYNDGPIKDPAALAGRFAAKEAIAKAMGTGIRGFSPADIEILADERGKPYVNLYSGALVVFKKLNASAVHLTISHCKNYAVAFAVIEG